jgi:membrane-associated phospholipid phosphatase
VATGSPNGRERRIVPSKAPLGKLRAVTTFALALAAATPGMARAQRTALPGAAAGPARLLPPALTDPLRFRVGAWPDGVTIGVGLTATAIPLIWPNAFPHVSCAPCNPSRLWGLDRDAVGPVRATANALSDVSLGTEAALGALFLAASRRGEGTAPFLEDATVIAQAVTLTAAATEWTKILVHRPRPFLYLSSAGPMPSAEDGRSFPSGHTSVAFAAAAAYASLLHRRGIAGRHKPDIAALFAAAALTGALRVVAHEHFPTDVAAGAALGFAIGWTIPAVHPTRP